MWYFTNMIFFKTLFPFPSGIKAKLLRLFGAQIGTGVVIKPDIVTLMVSPQDAVMLTYLVYSGAEITLTLRNPNDQALAAKLDGATLEYLLTQYNIPIPAKLPYSMQPRLDVLVEPELPNDATPVP